MKNKKIILGTSLGFLTVIIIFLLIFLLSLNGQKSYTFKDIEKTHSGDAILEHNKIFMDNSVKISKSDFLNKIETFDSLKILNEGDNKENINNKLSENKNIINNKEYKNISKRNKTFNQIDTQALLSHLYNYNIKNNKQELETNINNMDENDIKKNKRRGYKNAVENNFIQDQLKDYISVYTIIDYEIQEGNKKIIDLYSNEDFYTKNTNGNYLNKRETPIKMEVEISNKRIVGQSIMLKNNDVFLKLYSKNGTPYINVQTNDIADINNELVNNTTKNIISNSVSSIPYVGNILASPINQINSKKNTAIKVRISKNTYFLMK